MVLIACVDDNLGMLFNRRRVSQDRVLRKKLMESLAGGDLWLNTYSAGMFEPEYAAQLRIDDSFPEKVGEGETCFAENTDYTLYAERIEEIVLYRWNRAYPSDVKFIFPGGHENWKLVGTEEFAGYSHPKITKEIYTR